jgi:autotransporter passenger strand-loop-strand repeat protein
MSGTDDPPTLTAFTAGELVISISGDGDGSGTYGDNQASPITLNEVTTTGTIVGQLVLPETTTVRNGVTEYAISGEYGSSSEGSLQLSADGQSLVIAGYGVNDVTFNTGGASVYGTAALAQSTSVPGGKYTVVPRVIADISYNTTIDTSTTLYNVFNLNNPRSVATINGSTFYISGQGVKGDTTQGVFLAHDGASNATAIDNSTDTRTVEIVGGELYVSRDSTQGVGGQISSYGTTLPTTKTTATVLPGINGSITLTAAQANGVNNADIGTSINLSPENYFFASSTVLYVADGGNPKEGGLGDGGLQKWVFNGTSWTLDYTLSAGLNLVPDTAPSGSTGLIGLTGTVVGGTAYLYATNETVGDLDQTYLYGIADTISATSGTGETFTTLVTAAPDSNIRGVSFAPTQATSTPTVTSVTSNTTSTGIVVTSGSVLNVLSGGTAVAATILSGASATISGGGTDSGSTIAQGGNETVLGTASGDFVDGIQLVSAATAVVTNDMVFNGGSVELFLKGAIANSPTVEAGGSILISGNATANNAVLSGGLIELESSKAVLSGSLTFSGAGEIEVAAISSAGFGGLAIISGFGSGDVIDFTSVTSIGAAGSAATLTTATVSGNTVATVSGGGSSQAFTLAGTTLAKFLALMSDGHGGEELTFSAPPPTTSTITSGSTQSNLVIAGGSFLDILSGGTAVSATILSGGSATVELGGTDSSSTISSGGFETVSGSATLDQVYGTQLISAATAVVSNETVFNGGSADLFLKGAIANNLTLDSGGSLNISGNATANNTVVSGGEVELQSPKATLSGSITFASTGTLAVTSNTSAGFGDLAVISGFGSGVVVDMTSGTSVGAAGSAATLSTVTSGGNTVATLSGGGATETFIFAGSVTSNLQLTSDGNGGEEIVYTSSASTSSSSATSVTSGSTQRNLVVSGGTSLDVLSGGTIVSATILSGGSATVQLGGVDSATMISAGGNETVLGSATLDTIRGSMSISGAAVSETILSGGSATVQSTGSDVSATVSAGGTETVLGSALSDQVYGTQLVSAGTAQVTSETVYNGGSIELFLAGVTGTSLTAQAGGVIAISGHAVASNTVITGGEVALESAKATLSGSLVFSGAGTLAVTAITSSGYGDQAVISGFGAGDVIEFTSIGAGATLSTTTSSGNTVATISSGSVSQSLIFAGTTPDFTLVTSGGVAEVVPCFAAGTRIATARGEVAVEDLAVGDLVPTVLGGGAEPIIWIGRREVDCANHPAPRKVRPVRIAAGAFGPGRPHSDLLLSPDHAVHVGGVLIPVRCLVNGDTIVQVPVDRVTYYHIELPQHDVVLAQGLEAESYLDVKDRSDYANGPGPVRLYPDFSARMWEAFGCAPLVVTGPELEAARALVDALAGMQSAA